MEVGVPWSINVVGTGISRIKICRNATCMITTRRGIQHFYESVRSTITSIFVYIVTGRVKQQIIWRKARVLKESLAEETNALTVSF